jgi:hypothetical protein
MLEEVEIGPTCIIERNDFSIYYGVIWQVAQSLKNMLVLLVERLSSSRIEAQLPVRIDCERTISVEFDFIHPFWTVWQFRDRQTLHRFDKASFAAR